MSDAGRFTVNPSLHALPLHERLGFVATGPRTVVDGIAFVPTEPAGKPPRGPAAG